MPTTKRITSVLFILLMFISGMGASAQTEGEISDNELRQFASAFMQVQTINQQIQQEMAETVEEEGFEIQRFNEIQQAQQNPNQEVAATDEEIAKYKSAMEDLQTIQMQAQQKMEEKIVEEGLTIARYQEIATAIQANPDLQQKLQEYLQG